MPDKVQDHELLATLGLFRRDQEYCVTVTEEPGFGLSLTSVMIASLDKCPHYDDQLIVIRNANRKPSSGYPRRKWVLHRVDSCSSLGLVIGLDLHV